MWLTEPWHTDVVKTSWTRLQYFFMGTLSGQDFSMYPKRLMFPVLPPVENKPQTVGNISLQRIGTIRKSRVVVLWGLGKWAN